MDKLFISFIFLLTSYCALSQSTTLGVLAGPNQSKFYFPGQNDSSPSSITGFHFGVFTEFTLHNFSIEPKILYANIGGSNYDIDAHIGGTSTDRIRVNYLQIPVNFLYNIPVSFGKIFFGGGPYAGFGLSGTDKYDGSYADDNILHINIGKEKYKFSNVDNPDYGWNATIGIHFKNRWLFSAEYGHGLKTAFRTQYSGYNYGGLANNVKSFTVGYTIF